MESVPSPMPKLSENGLPDATYYGLLTSGGTAFPARFPTPHNRRYCHGSLLHLPGGTFQLTNTKARHFTWILTPPARFTALPDVQQADCTLLYAQSRIQRLQIRSFYLDKMPVTVGSNLNAWPAFQLQHRLFAAAKPPAEGAQSWASYNVLQATCPTFKQLADNYTP